MIRIYGINNCDTVKKARRWLETNHIDYDFHDFRQHGLDKTLLSDWVKQLGWEAVLNKRSTSWRELSAEQKSTMNTQTAIAAMLATPTLIKRPVLVTDNQLDFGFNAQHYHDYFNR